MATKTKEILSDKELARLQEAAKQGCDPWVGARNAAWLEINYRCTLRISESLDLKVLDYSPEHEVLIIRKGKGDKARKVAVGDKVRPCIEQWLEIRRQRVTDDNKPIFCTRTGGRLSRENMAHQMVKWAEKARVYKRVHPHQLRYSGASAMLRNGAPISHIQGQLGHSKPIVTMAYLLDVDPHQRVQDHKKWEP